MITAAKIRLALLAAGIPPAVIHLMDSDYDLPTRDWVTQNLGNAFADFLYNNDILYREEQFDCNAFAVSAVTIAKWAWFKTRPDETALAFGLFAFTDFNEGGHVICVSLHTHHPDGSAIAPGEPLAVQFYEPQPQPPPGLTSFYRSSMPCLLTKNPSPEEIKTCCACLFV